MCRYIRHEAEATVQRLRQAQRRDTGLPYVDIMANETQPTTSLHQVGSGGANGESSANGYSNVDLQDGAPNGSLVKSQPSSVQSATLEEA